MKPFIKKLSTIAMSFLILGTSIAFSKNLSAKPENSYSCITANAACSHNGQRFAYGSWKFTGYILKYYEPKPGPVIGETQRRTITVKCSKCNQVLYTYTEDRKIFY